MTYEEHLDEVATLLTEIYVITSYSIHYTKLYEVGKRRIVASQQLRVQTPAAAANASGGVSALVAASGELATQLRDWLDRLEADGVLKNCGG